MIEKKTDIGIKFEENNLDSLCSKQTFNEETITIPCYR